MAYVKRIRMKVKATLVIEDRTLELARNQVALIDFSTEVLYRYLKSTDVFEEDSSESTVRSASPYLQVLTAPGLVKSRLAPELVLDKEVVKAEPRQRLIEPSLLKPRMKNDRSRHSDVAPDGVQSADTGDAKRDANAARA